MRVRLAQLGQGTCIPLPAEASRVEGFGAGDEVEVMWDQSQARLLVRALQGGAAKPPADVSVDISSFIEGFIRRYEGALKELANR